jgi:hypothetical protein
MGRGWAGCLCRASAQWSLRDYPRNPQALTGRPYRASCPGRPQSGFLSDYPYACGLLGISRRPAQATSPAPPHPGVSALHSGANGEALGGGFCFSGPLAAERGFRLRRFSGMKIEDRWGRKPLRAGRNQVGSVAREARSASQESPEKQKLTHKAGSLASKTHKARRGVPSKAALSRTKDQQP